MVIDVPATSASRMSITFQSALSARVNDSAFVALALGVALAPVWLGGNRPIVWALNAIAFGTLTAVYELALIWSGRRHPVGIRMIRFPATAVCITCLWIMTQTAIWIPDAYHHPIWRLAGDALGTALPGSISVARDSTLAGLFRLLTLACVFWLALQTCRSGRRAHRMVVLVAVLGFAYAAYGILAFFAFPAAPSSADGSPVNTALSATFVNRNSYATYAGIGLLAAMTQVLDAFSARIDAHSSRLRLLARFIANITGPGGFWIGCVFVIGIALVLTGSRGGIFSTALGMLALTTMVAIRAGHRAAGAASGVLLTLLVVGLAFVGFGDVLADRLATTGLSLDGRLAVYHLTWLSIADAPWSGFGHGAFQPVFAIYRDLSLAPFGIWDFAHNTYLEILQGLGLPVGLLFLAGVAALVLRCPIATLTRKRGVSAPLLATSAGVLVMMHALVDFSMQIQGIAITWTALLGAGVAQSWSSRQSLSG